MFEMRGSLGKKTIGVSIPTPVKYDKPIIKRVDLKHQNVILSKSAFLPDYVASGCF